MKSMKSLSREDAHEIIDKVYNKLIDKGDASNEVGSLFTYKSYDGMLGYHSVIMLNCEDELL